MIKTKNRVISFILAVLFVVACAEPTLAYAKNNAAAPVVTKGGNVKYSYVYYGNYPQREVVCTNDAAQISALKSRNVNSYKKVSKSTWDKIVKAKYNKSGDATVGGVKYRRIKMTDATQAQTDTPELYRWLDSSTYHYFMYEPIKWRVLENSKGKALLLSEYALDDEKYNDTKSAVLMWNIRWKNSTMRSWLNGYAKSKNACNENFKNDNFIDAAFTKTEQKKLLTRKMGGNVKDKVFLLYESDIYNTDVALKRGFISSKYRTARCTTYAYAKGIWRPTQNDKQDVMWWVNTDDAGDMAPNITYFGDVDSDGRNNNKDAIGVRPAIIVSSTTLSKMKTAK